MTARRATVIGALIIACFLLAGCRSTETSGVSDMTPSEAKARMQQIESEIVDRLPAEAVASVDPPREGVLMSCAAEGVYSRASGVLIHIAAEQSPDSLLPELAAAYEDDERFAVRDVSSDVREAIQLVGADGEGYVIGTSSDGNVLRIDSFSPCFELPADMSPFDRF